MDKILTCFVGCRLQITSFPPYLAVSNGRLPLGIICNVVPRHILKSATLEKNIHGQVSILPQKIKFYYTGT